MHVADLEATLKSGRDGKGWTRWQRVDAMAKGGRDGKGWTRRQRRDEHA